MHLLSWNCFSVGLWGSKPGSPLSLHGRTIRHIPLPRSDQAVVEVKGILYRHYAARTIGIVRQLNHQRSCFIRIVSLRPVCPYRKSSMADCAVGPRRE
jgi:hypothetical protein